MPQCFKIVQKVAFNIASEASYVYILSGQRFHKIAKNGQFWRVFSKLTACGQTVLPGWSLTFSIRSENAKIQLRHFESFLVKQCYQSGHFLQDKNY